MLHEPLFEPLRAAQSTTLSIVEDASGALPGAAR
jgi:hypothetical protein